MLRIMHIAADFQCDIDRAKLSSIDVFRNRHSGVNPVSSILVPLGLYNNVQCTSIRQKFCRTSRLSYRLLHECSTAP